jgi:phosphatidylglycerophosphate synthase
MAVTTAPLPVLAKLPNALTIARFALVPLFVVLMAKADGGHSWAAGIVFGVAAITDQVDGSRAAGTWSRSSGSTPTRSPTA